VVYPKVAGRAVPPHSGGERWAGVGRIQGGGRAMVRPEDDHGPPSARTELLAWQRKPTPSLVEAVADPPETTEPSGPPGGPDGSVAFNDRQRFLLEFIAVQPTALGAEWGRRGLHRRDADREDAGQLVPRWHLQNLVNILFGSGPEKRDPRSQPLGNGR
jgi:hypothetical protein